MTLAFKRRFRTEFLAVTLIGLSFLLIVGCDPTPDRIFTIGIAAWDTQSAENHLEGFRDQMAKFGYVEGQDVEYLYEIIPRERLYDLQFIESRLKKLISQDLDLLLVAGQEVTVVGQEVSQGTDLPVLFSGTAWPVRFGFVDSLEHPGGNMTGVRFANSVPKALEWLAYIAKAGKIYLPYNPDDDISIKCLDGLDETAEKLGVELVLQEVHSVEEAVSGINGLPEDVGAIYRIPSPTLDLRNIELSRAAIERGLPMCAPLQLDDTMLATFSNDEFDVGTKLARLAQQIMGGVKPSELPVETAEVYLTINVNTAEKIRLDMPDEVLAQAKNIIR